MIEFTSMYNCEFCSGHKKGEEQHSSPFLCFMGNFVRSFNQKANARGDVERDARALACDGVVCIS